MAEEQIREPYRRNGFVRSACAWSVATPLRFILIYGVVLFGGLWGLLMALALPPALGMLLPVRITGHAILYVFASVIAGFIWGWWMWRVYVAPRLRRQPPSKVLHDTN